MKVEMELTKDEFKTLMLCVWDSSDKIWNHMEDIKEENALKQMFRDQQNNIKVIARQLKKIEGETI